MPDRSSKPAFAREKCLDLAQTVGSLAGWPRTAIALCVVRRQFDPLGGPVDAHLVRQSNQAFLTALSEVKTMVTVGAHSAARWVRTNAGRVWCGLTRVPMPERSCWLSGLLACQLTLPLWNVQKT